MLFIRILISFVASSETLSNGQSYSLSAEVGLLTRNIKIIGEEYSKMDEESFGARVLIGLTADTTRSYTGISLWVLNMYIIINNEGDITVTFH